MNNKDEQLISKFMHANKLEMPDNGFSRRVMRHLPVRAKVLSDILTGICIIVSCILFFVFDGVNLIYQSLIPAIQQSFTQLIENMNIQTWIALVAILTYFGIQKVISLSE